MTAQQPLRDDWLDRRAAFFRERAAELFPSSPVASTFERRLREEYLDHCARTVELISPSEFAHIAATEKWRSVARLGPFLGGLIGAVAGFVLAGLVAAVVLAAVVAIGGMYVGLGVGSLYREVFLARVDAVARDRRAYGEWSTAAASSESICICSYRNRIHDHDCPELLTRPISVNSASHLAVQTRGLLCGSP